MDVGLALLNLVTRMQLRAQEADAEPSWGVGREPPAHRSVSLVWCHCCGPGLYFPSHSSLSKTVPSPQPAIHHF